MRPEHQFTKGIDHFEHAVFDGACRFVVAIMAGRDKRSRHDHGLDLIAAINQAKADARAVVYAVAPSGRHMVLDRAKWRYWLARRQQCLAGRIGKPFYFSRRQRPAD